MTPLEKALQKENRCNDTTIINGVMYCNKSGKIILPMFTKGLEELNKPYQQTYNKTCRHYCECNGEKYCGIDMDMIFCGKNCAFASNMPGSSKEYKGNVIVNNRRVQERK